MDEAGRLIREYHMLASSSVASRLDVLLDLVRIRDPQVMPFLLKVLGDRSESRESAHPCAEALRNGDGLVAPVERPQFAKAIGDVSADNSTTQLRVEAAPALGLFTEIDGVLTAFSTLALAREGSIDLRYAAFTSLERAGPAPESISLMRQISGNETLGNSAWTVLSAWHVE